MAPNTFTFDDIGSNAPSAAGLMGRPRRLPTKNGCGVGVCWADSELARMASGKVSFTMLLQIMMSLSGVDGFVVRIYVKARWRNKIARLGRRSRAPVARGYREDTEDVISDAGVLLGV